MGVSARACPRGRVQGPGVDCAFPSVCYFNVHTTNNETAHLTVVMFTDSRNSQNNNFQVWNVEGKIQTEESGLYLNMRHINGLILLGQCG